MLRCKVWLYQGKAAWHFVSLPLKVSQEIRHWFGGVARGWGSLPVQVTIKKTIWKTSIFPENKTGAYLLPLKAKVREKESIRRGQTPSLTLQVLT